MKCANENATVAGLEPSGGVAKTRGNCMKNTQNKQLLALLQKQPVTSLDALNKIGCLRLSARIHNLREQGHNIISQRVAVGGKKVARYSLEVA